jgi:hypothetical protein
MGRRGGCDGEKRGIVMDRREDYEGLQREWREMNRINSKGDPEVWFRNPQEGVVL